MSNNSEIDYNDINEHISYNEMLYLLREVQLLVQFLEKQR